MDRKLENILQGPVPSNELPNVSVGKLLFDCFKKQSDQEALIDAATNAYLTYKDLYNGTVGLAIKLKSLGYKKDDTFAIVSENVIEYCIPAISGLYLGCVIAPMNPGYTLREFVHSMNISKPRVIFCSTKLGPMMKDVQKSLNFIDIIVTFGDEITELDVPTLKEFIGNNIDIDNFEPNDLNVETQVATILCSSGTTGLPKGVMQSHKNLIPVFEQMRNPNFGNVRASNVGYGLLPFFHVYGFTLQLVYLLVGAKFIVLKKFETELFLSSIQKYQITNLYLVPPLMSLLAKHPLVDKYNLSSVTDILCAAAPLTKDIELAVCLRLKLNCIRQGYGMTESTFAICVTPPGTKNKFGASGMLVPRTEAKIRDLNTNESLGPNKKGEMCIRSPMVMMGYKNDKQATDNTVIDGWLHTGDVAYYDEDGFFFIVDRIKELIKYKGFQVPPAELESILMMHPSVKDCAVIGQPDERSGEIPVAFIVKQQNQEIKEQELVDYLAEHISAEKRLHGGVKFIDEIPRTGSGKILRRVLKELLVSQIRGG